VTSWAIEGSQQSPGVGRVRKQIERALAFHLEARALPVTYAWHPHAPHTPSLAIFLIHVMHHVTYVIAPLILQ
jgi:hypothetical protein